MAVFEARLISIREVHAELAFERRDLVRKAQCSDKPGPLLGGQGGDHEAHIVPTAEIAAERPPDGIAQAFTICPAIEHFRHRPAIRDRAHGHVSQRHAHLAALSGGVAASQGGQQSEGAVGPGNEIPGGEHLIDRRCGAIVPLLRPAH